MHDEPSTMTTPRPSNCDPRDQPMGHFAPGAVHSGFHVDLRGVAGSYGRPSEAEAWLELLTNRRERIMPTTVLQLGLGAWQRSIDADDPDRAEWAHVAQLVTEWAIVDMDGHGRFAHLAPMPHTYRLDPPWFSVLPQALAVSLFVRHNLGREAQRAARVLLDPAYGLITESDAGPILEEYPTDPGAHVLNGWMWALYGLADLAHATAPDLDETVRASAHSAFAAGVESLIAQLDEYETGRGWTTYDRYPHAIANIASPFYHRLHIGMIRALARVAPEPAQQSQLELRGERWERALNRPITRAAAVARKVGFRIVKPRRKAA